MWRSIDPSGASAPFTGDSDDDEAAEPDEPDEPEPEPEPMTMAPTMDAGETFDEGYDSDMGGGFGGDDDEEEDEDSMRKEALINAQDINDPDGGGAAALVDFTNNADIEPRMRMREVEKEELEDLTPEEIAKRGLLSKRAQRLVATGQNWQGPQHWKFKSSASKAGGGGGASKGGGKAKAKGQFLIDFSQGAKLAAEIEGAKKPTRMAINMTAAARAKAKETETILPLDYHCTMDTLEVCFEKPWLKVSAKSRKLTKEKEAVAERSEAMPRSPAPKTGGDGTLVEEEDEHDVGGGGLQFDEQYEDDGFGGGGDSPPRSPPRSPLADGASAEADGASNAAGGGALQFVAAAQKVEKIEIGYAKRAKQVDIKGLKADLWTLLQAEGKKTVAKAGGGKGKERAEVSFQAVLSRLSEKMEPAKLADVSFAYCFICLLHLANENNLEVLGDGDMKDMRVLL